MSGSVYFVQALSIALISCDRDEIAVTLLMSDDIGPPAPDKVEYNPEYFADTNVVAFAVLSELLAPVAPAGGAPARGKFDAIAIDAANNGDYWVGWLS